MTFPQTCSAWAWFRTIAPDSYFDELNRRHSLGCRKRIYWLGVVVWLMIYQRLRGDASLMTAVLALPGGGKPGAQSVSTATGAYCQARQRLPTLVAEQVSDHVFQTLRAHVAGPQQRPVFVVDGTTLRLEHEPDLVEAFPPGSNQRGENRWPVLLLVAYHDAHTGLAARPAWGPMYGDAAVSEQQLAAQALDRVPAGALVLGDGNFGIFAFAYAVVQSQRPVLLRLTAQRAAKILGKLPNKATRRKVVWQPSPRERTVHPELPAEAQLEGWAITCAHPQRPQEKLYLFTTLDYGPTQALAQYKLRWNIETDLRHLKRTVHLHQIRSRSQDLVEKELLLAVTAYNLIRAVMFQAAQARACTPRQLSFAHVQAAVLAALPSLQQARTRRECQRRMRALLQVAMQLTLPRRKRKRRSYPRQVWKRGGSFPLRLVHPASPERP